MRLIEQAQHSVRQIAATYRDRRLFSYVDRIPDDCSRFRAHAFRNNVAAVRIVLLRRVVRALNHLDGMEPDIRLIPVGLVDFILRKRCADHRERVAQCFEFRIGSLALARYLATRAEDFIGAQYPLLRKRDLHVEAKETGVTLFGIDEFRFHLAQQHIDPRVVRHSQVSNAKSRAEQKHHVYPSLMNVARLGQSDGNRSIKVVTNAHREDCITIDAVRGGGGCQYPRLMGTGAGSTAQEIAEITFPSNEASQ